MAAESTAAQRGSMTDVMAHELVVGCLVRLALVAKGETAVEVLSVLGHERGRARVRERLGRGAAGPMEEVVAKVGFLGCIIRWMGLHVCTSYFAFLLVSFARCVFAMSGVLDTRLCAIFPAPNPARLAERAAHPLLTYKEPGMPIL